MADTKDNFEDKLNKFVGVHIAEIISAFLAISIVCLLIELIFFANRPYEYIWTQTVLAMFCGLFLGAAFTGVLFWIFNKEN